MSDRLRLTDRDRQLVQLVSRCRLLSRDQVMRIAPFRSLTRANTRLALLVQERLLCRKLMPSYPGKGGAQALYFPGPAAETLGIERESLARQSRQVRRWDLRHTAHVLAANEVLTAFIAALRGREDAELLAFSTEPELRQAFVDRALVPDGWLSWAQGGKRFNSFLEVDLHHEGLTDWRTKILHYLEYADAGLHPELFGYRSFRVLVIAKSVARQNHLRRIAETGGRLFLFAHLGQVSADTVLGPRWLSALGTVAIPLAEA
jgi:hypothetical protein